MTSNASAKRSQPSSYALEEGIKAPLGGALSSLSISLEEELNRYRRQRQGQEPTLPQRLRMKVRQKPIDLISIPAKPVPPKSATPHPQMPNVSGVVAMPPPPPPNPFLAKQIQRDHQEAAAYAKANHQLEPLGSATQVGASPSDGGGSGDSGIALSPLEDRLEDRSQLEDSQWENRSTATHAHAHALISPHTFAPDDYLTSSEALINSFATPASPPSEKRQSARSLVLWPDGLSSPLGLGILMVVLVGSAGFGYVLTNPTALGKIPLVKRLIAGSEATAELTTPAGDNAPLSSNPLQGAGPDLSVREFQELNLHTLSTIEVDPSAVRFDVVPTETDASTSTTASTASTTTAADSEATNAATGTVESETSSRPSAAVASANSGQTSRPQSQGQATPTNRLPTPRASQPAARSQGPAQPQTRPSAPASPAAASPAAASSQSQPLAPASSSPAPSSPAPSSPASSSPASSSPATPQPSTTSNSANDYNVVTDFTGDQSLQEARDAVGDAYVRNYADGPAQIQLGTYDNPETAQQRVQELQDQGIPARVQGE